MIASASRATLVIANPTHFAIALRYNRDENPAPLVVAKGMDVIALKIREVAEQNRIPVIENKALARALYEAVQVDQVIPAEFFRRSPRSSTSCSRSRRRGPRRFSRFTRMVLRPTA